MRRTIKRSWSRMDKAWVMAKEKKTSLTRSKTKNNSKDSRIMNQKTTSLKKSRKKMIKMRRKRITISR